MSRLDDLRDELDILELRMKQEDQEESEKSARKIKEILEKVLDQVFNPCPYTLSHTRHWCGHSGCRES